MVGDVLPLGTAAQRPHNVPLVHHMLDVLLASDAIFGELFESVLLACDSVTDE